MIKAVIFDFGQTLVNSAYGFRTAEKEAQDKLFKNLGLTVRDDFMAIYRRYIMKPPRLESKAKGNFVFDDAYTLIMLFLIAITGYFAEGLRIAIAQPDWANWSPVGNALASLFINADVATNQIFHFVLWAVHALAAFGLIASVPLLNSPM